jgi:hydroxyacylglutathione hydrolase
MHIQQLYTTCLSEAAYYIENEGVAAIVDPMRDVEEYIELARQRGAEIKYIFETHFHADFVSGHIDLSKATGATIIYGPETHANFPFHLAKDGEVFPLGKLSIKVLHTPGHTLESTCFLLFDENGNEHAIFTGDTLFVGDVGRPDLAQKNESVTTADLAGMLYDSLQNKIVPLPDNVIVYPAHGAGSSCGKNLGPSTESTIGDEKQTNYALKAESKEEFVKAVTEGLDEPPQYFPINAKINKEGYPELDEILDSALKPLSLDEFKEKLADENTILIDTRNGSTFSESFVPGSVFIGLEGRFAEWAGSILSFDKQIILVTEPGREKETAVRLARVGFHKLSGYLEGSFEKWKKAGEPIDMIIDVEADEVAMDLPFDENMVLVDVRREIEFDESHIKEAVNIPLSNLTDPASMANINDEDNLYIYCASGYRSVIASSLIKRQGIHNLRNVVGGFKALKEIPSLEIEKSKSALN